MKNSKKTSYSRPIFLICILIIIVYIGKIYVPVKKAVREHGLASWILPAINGISTLIIVPDDGIYHNSIKTGTRIWLNPPQNASILEKNYALFGGPSLILIGSQISDSTIINASNYVDTLGNILILESGNRTLAEITKLNKKIKHISLQHRNLQESTILRDSLNLDVGSDVKSTLYLDSNGYHFSLQTLTHQFNFFENQAIFYKKNSLNKYSVGGIINKTTDAMNFNYSQANTFILNQNDVNEELNVNDSTLININENNYGVIFYEDGKHILKLQKIFLHSKAY